MKFIHRITLGAIIALASFTSNAFGIEYPMKNLRFGDNGSSVKQLQKAFNLPQTGNFKSLTKSRVIEWQKAHGLPATGFWGPMSQKEAQKGMERVKNEEKKIEKPSTSRPSEQVAKVQVKSTSKIAVKAQNSSRGIFGWFNDASNSRSKVSSKEFTAHIRSTHYYPFEGYYKRVAVRKSNGKPLRKNGQIVTRRVWVNTSDRDTDRGRSAWQVPLRYATTNRIGTCAANPTQVAPGSLIEVVDDGELLRYLVVDKGGFSVWNKALRKVARTRAQAHAAVVDFFSRDQVGGTFTNVRIIPPKVNFAALSIDERKQYLSFEAWGLKPGGRRTIHSNRVYLARR